MWNVRIKQCSTRKYKLFSQRVLDVLKICSKKICTAVHILGFVRYFRAISISYLQFLLFLLLVFNYFLMFSYHLKLFFTMSLKSNLTEAFSNASQTHFAGSTKELNYVMRAWSIITLIT